MLAERSRTRRSLETTSKRNIQHQIFLSNTKHEKKTEYVERKLYRNNTKLTRFLLHVRVAISTSNINHMIPFIYSCFKRYLYYIITQLPFEIKITTGRSPGIFNSNRCLSYEIEVVQAISNTAEYTPEIGAIFQPTIVERRPRASIPPSRILYLTAKMLITHCC